MKHALLPLLPILACLSCNSNSVDIKQQRDKVIDVTEMVKEFPMEEVLIGNNALLAGSDRNLYILDAGATDEFVSVFSLPDGKFIGQFMDFGGGPNEVASPGSLNIFTSPTDGREKLLVIDHGNLRTSAYDVDSALTDSSYIAQRYRPLDATVQPSHYIYINDTLGFARKIVINQETNNFDQALGKYNLITGELSDFAPEEHIKGNRSLFTVARNEKRVIEVGSNVDLVVIYDFDGNVIRRIQGPNYKPEAERRKAYFSSATVAGPYILGVYSGGDWNTAYLGKRIEVWDVDGNYIASLNVGKEIRNMFYHAPSGILWLSLRNDEMQFATLNLQEALAQAPSTAKEEAEDEVKPEENKTAKILDCAPPLIFLSDNLQDTLSRFDIGRIILEKGEEVSYPNKSSIILAGGPSEAPLIENSDTIWLESLDQSPQFLRSNIPTRYLKCKMITILWVGFDPNTPEGPFEGKVEIRAKGYKHPTILPVTGTIAYE